MKPYRWTLLLALPVTLLMACADPGPEAALEEYLTRLARSLDMPKPVVADVHIPTPPRPGQLRLPLAASGIDGLDFLALRGCALQVTVGKRNSSLGRMAPPSQRLLLELEYLRLAPDCVQQLQQEQRQQLATTLQQAWDQKRLRLPAMIFNATLGSAEYRSLWQAGRRAGQYPATGSSEVITALEAIDEMARRWLAGDYRADNQAFELLLGTVAGGDAGALWQALATQGAWLDTADQVLARRAASSPLCAPSIRHEAADILPNVVQRFFIDGIQPRAARLEQRAYQLLPVIAGLEQQLAAALPPAYRAWQEPRDRELAHLRSAPRRHVKAIQQILAPCGPGTLGRPAQG